MRLAILTMWAITLAGRGAPALAQPTGPKPEEPITLSLDGDRVQYTADRKRATVTGNVRIVVSAPGYTARPAVLQADQVTANLVSGEIETPGGARLLVGPALLAGEALHFSAPRQEFTMSKARGLMILRPPGQDPCEAFPAAYLTSAKISKKGALLNLQYARVTTCPKDHPHYYVKAKRIKYDTNREKVTVYNAKINLYGISIPLVPWAEIRVGSSGGSGKKLSLSTVPGYSSREGVYLPYGFNLAGPDSNWDAATSFRITTKRGVTGSVWASREAGPWDIHARASRKEWAADDTTDLLSIDRLPELDFRYYISPRDRCEKHITADISLGNYQETLENQRVGVPRRPQVHEHRLLGALNYTANHCEYIAHRGDWYGATGRVSTYSSGETYRDLEVFAGIGDDVTDDMHLWGTLRQHFPGGTTPFLFDDVDIETEVEAGANWRVTGKWGLEGWGRYDVDRTDMRDYEVGATYNAGCLQWGLFYRGVGNRIGIRADISGLTGDTRAVARKSTWQKEMEAKGLKAIHPDEVGCKLKISGEDYGFMHPPPGSAAGAKATTDPAGAEPADDTPKEAE